MSGVQNPPVTADALAVEQVGTQTSLRETSSATTRLVLGFVRDAKGDVGVAQVLERAALPETLDVLESDSHWVSYDARIALFQAAVEVLGDRRAMFDIGASVMRQSVSPSLVLLLRALGSPAQVFRSLPRAVSKFSTTSTMRILEAGRTHATIRYQLHEGYVHSRLDCQYAQGLFTVVPTLFGLPAAKVVHDECESDGAEACVYHVTWARRSRWRRRAAEAATDVAELTALRAQLHELLSAASDLVSGDNVEEVLQRITERAAGAVLAQGYLLAVESPYGGPPLVHAFGVEPARAVALAEELLAGADLGASAVVVDVASSLRHHGRLAALYPQGQRGLADESLLLTAYAGHAAAALDMISALEGSRRGERRATTLLALSHQLAGTDDTNTVASMVAAALPEVVGCSIASVLLWDPSHGELFGAASAGLTDKGREQLMAARLAPQDTPELAQMLTRLEPVLLVIDEVGPVLRELLTQTEVTHVIAVPLLAGGELLGVATASWSSSAPPRDGQAELKLRLRGVADQAAAALQNAQLVTAIRHQALHDALSGLPNRVLFTDRLEQALRGRNRHGQVGVLFCDLDQFKQVNDVLGHAAGDELLRQVAGRLQAAVRDGDSVARLSGDEFAVLLPEVTDLEAALDVASRVTSCFDRPFRIEGQDLRITISVGVAVHAGADGRVDRLMRDADGAMYDAKQRGRNQIALAANAPGSAVDISMDAELADALAGDELRVLLQPIVDIRDAHVVGSEALVRWQHPRLGLLSPATFLPVAEESNLVVELDLWVLREACRLLGARPVDEQGRPLTIAVNLSGRTLQDASLVSRVRDVLYETKVPAGQLELEVVESRALADLPGLTDRLTALRRLGVRIALDDFGTGFSTLTWLQRLPVDRIKVDRSFTATIGRDLASSALVRGVMALAKQLGLEVVAEGVETEDQLAGLRAAGCHLVQGYLFGAPAPAEQEPCRAGASHV